jgi:BASS family bile acid:Na+ symporter
MLRNLSDFLSGKASIFIILTAVVTFFFPQLFARVKGDTQTVILGIIMLTMGLTLTPGDFKLLAQRPFDILIGAAAPRPFGPRILFDPPAAIREQEFGGRVLLVCKILDR